MPARIMLSSVTKDDIPLGDIRQLNDSWYQAVSLPERIRNIGKPPKPETRLSFTDVRREVQHHLEGKYGFEVFNFQNSHTDGGSPETETQRETHRSHFVIGLFGTQSGWKVPDQDPLTPTFREWRSGSRKSSQIRDICAQRVVFRFHAAPTQCLDSRHY